MQGFRFVKDLKGFSGCKLKIYSSKKDDFFVRKISGSTDYNERLKKQMQKQIIFYQNFSCDNIKTPKVLNSGYLDGLFFFDMEYINGVTLIEHILSSSPNGLKEISSVIIKILSFFENTETNDVIEASLRIKLKLDDIESKIKKNLKEINDLRNEFVEFSVKKSFCHGDLTFENILYDKHSNSYYLIDFLDSFIENYFFDLVKLFQDLDGKWYLFRNPKIDRELMDIKMFFIREFIWEKYVLNKNYAPFHQSLLKLNFLRILPYTNENQFPEVLKIIKEL
jgi:serine/threonine protein kinase